MLILMGYGPFVSPWSGIPIAWCGAFVVCSLWYVICVGMTDLNLSWEFYFPYSSIRVCWS